MMSFIMKLPCGSNAEFDYAAGHGYRCTTCNAVVGSVGMPDKCKSAVEKYDMLKNLGSHIRWNYETGEEVVVVEFGE